MTSSSPSPTSPEAQPLPPLSFSLPQRIVHWVMVVLIVWQYISAQGFDAARAAGSAGIAPDERTLGLIQSHAYVGMAIFVLAVIRLWLHSIYGLPEQPPGEPVFFQFAAMAGHVALHAMILLLPFTGMLQMFLGIDMAGDTHRAVQGLLMLMIAIHVVAVLIHQFYWKTNVLARMTYGVKKNR